MTRVLGYPATRRHSIVYRQSQSASEATGLSSGTRIAVSPGMPAPALRLVRDTEVSTGLRPTCFDDYIGQADVINNLRQAVRAAKRGGWQLDHQLFTGGAGCGKTSLAAVIATELGAKFHATSAPAIEHKGALATLLTTLEDGDVLFIDEIHALNQKIAEVLYTALEDQVLDMSAGKRVVRVPLPRFTLLAATTHAGKLSKPLLDRFGFVWQLRSYTLPEMELIVTRSAVCLGIAIDEAGACAIARASRGTPRIANRLLRRVRDAAVSAVIDGALVLRDRAANTAVIDGPVAEASLEQLGIDHLGLDGLDRRYLALVADRPVGIEALCAALGEQRCTLEEVIEPFLMQAGLICRSGKGRVATEVGRAHLETRS